MLYEQRKHDGSLPIVGVNTFTDPDPDANRAAPAKVELARATEAEKQSQLNRLADFQARHAEVAPAVLRRLEEAAAGGGNVFRSTALPAPSRLRSPRWITRSGAQAPT